MRFIVCILLILGCCQVQAQLVVTVAGVVDSVGNLDGPVYEATFNNPHGIAVDQNGNVYTADRYSHTIRKITPDGFVETIAGINGVSGTQDGPGPTATFNEPWGICVDPFGNVVVADTRNNKIRKIDAAGTVSTLAGTGNFGVSNGPALASTFGNPTGVEYDAAGNLYVADHLTHIIRKITPDGQVSTLAGTPYITGSVDGVQASFYRPYGLTVDLDGNVLVADEWNHKIRKITPDGQVSTIAGSGLLGSTDGIANIASFNYPWDITVDEQGNIFVADGYNYTVRKIFPSGNVSTYVGNVGQTGAIDGIGFLAHFNGATAIEINSTTQEIYVADAYNNLVRKIIDLDQDISLIVTSGSTTFCEGDFFSVDINPEIFNIYDFYVDDVLIQSGTSPTFSTTTLSPGQHNIQGIGNDGTTSSVSEYIQVTVLAATVPTVSVVGATTFFSGDSVTLVSSQAESYFWSTGETTQTITIYDSGDYYVEITDANGCTGTSEYINVQVQTLSEIPIITVDGNTELCPGASTILVSSYLLNNQWLKDGWPIDGATAATYTIEEAGIYQVQFTDSLGLIYISDPLEISVADPQIIDFSASQTNVEAGTAISLTATVNGNLSYEWQTAGQTSNEVSPDFIINDPGIYDVLLVTSDGICTDTLAKPEYLRITAPNEGNNPPTNTTDADWFLPSAFSPNGDGSNDVFLLRGNGLSSVQMAIYNQWGEQVFVSSDQQNGWDGKHNNTEVQTGTYVYMVSFKDQSGAFIQTSGHITVLY